jgi:hypothetical protein
MVRLIKMSTCIHFSCKNGLKQDVLLPLFFNSALECAIRNVLGRTGELKIGTYQFLFYNDLNVLGAGKRTIEGNTKLQFSLVMSLVQN